MSLVDLFMLNQLDGREFKEYSGSGYSCDEYLIDNEENMPNIQDFFISVNMRFWHDGIEYHCEMINDFDEESEPIVLKACHKDSLRGLVSKQVNIMTLKGFKRNELK